MDNIIYAKVIEKLIKLRKKYELSICNIADYVGVSRQSIYNFESKKCKSCKIMLSYLTYPAFSRDEVNEIYDLMRG